MRPVSPVAPAPVESGRDVPPADLSLPCAAPHLSGVSYGDRVLPFRNAVKRLGAIRIVRQAHRGGSAQVRKRPIGESTRDFQPHGSGPRKADFSRARQPATTGPRRPIWSQTTPARHIKTHGFGLQGGCRRPFRGSRGGLSEDDFLQISSGPQRVRTADLRRANAPTKVLVGTAKCR